MASYRDEHYHHDQPLTLDDLETKINVSSADSTSYHRVQTFQLLSRYHSYICYLFPLRLFI